GPRRHVRVQREAQRGPAGRRPARLRRLRGGRPAHRGRAAPPVQRGAAGRGGEGPPGGLRHPAPVLDDGRLTDGQGRTVDFRNTILVLTSNLGSQFLVDPLTTETEKKEQVLEVVRASFKPEFL